MTALPRFIALGLLAASLPMAAGAPPAHAAVPDPVLPSLVIPLVMAPPEPETLP